MAGIVVIFDFDKTIVDCDSDNWVVDEMGVTALFDELLPTMPWNPLMDRMMRELHSRGRTVEEIAECLKRAPLHPQIITAIKTAYALGCELRIVSDANLFFIETILKHHGLFGYFSEINTNPGFVDEEGRLRIFPYHDFTSSSHGCTLCPPNMCKSAVVERMQGSFLGDTKKKRLIYLGDGKGDFCPSLKLGEGDFVMPRKDFPLWDLIYANPLLLKAGVHEWSYGEDQERVLLHLIDQILTEENSASQLLSSDCKANTVPISTPEAVLQALRPRPHLITERNRDGDRPFLSLRIGRQGSFICKEGKTIEDLLIAADCLKRVPGPASPPLKLREKLCLLSMAGVVVVFDFDKTLIDWDSDNWVVNQMGVTDVFHELYPTLPWNSLMDRMMGEIHSQGKTVDEIAECLKAAPLQPHIVKAIKSAYALGCDLKIVSDANHFFIETVLKHHQLFEYFSEINTNPSFIDEDGKLRIMPYHDISCPHSCNHCPSNLCKGLVIDRIRTCLSELGHERYIYVGDGRGDFCPCLKLKKGDFVMPRKNFPLWDLIYSNPLLLKADVQEWSSAEELERILLRLIHKVSSEEKTSIESPPCDSDCKVWPVPIALHEASPQTLPVSH
ncbi:hypothetical protein H6P81_001065 [Aristolochia fimbriata]|uniref:Uncharacterized protein n=1 Tax=Aristolochia fimbriata TaxID=158543 RepID=A0AAV7F9U7_ARIFI|nr:hypothetical protein H6P81_001065 [Aristolochia fimbriata]